MINAVSKIFQPYNSGFIYQTSDILQFGPSIKKGIVMNTELWLGIYLEKSIQFFKQNNYVCSEKKLMIFFKNPFHNHWADFIQTWHKVSMMKVVEVCSNEMRRPVP